ncbi:TrbC/VirB2 family protein [Sphingomonas suaedae]|uniref:TrbC/VirB2 family protein n=1 Tax=Sphingomonas suaedae TaxID=2599297 RepID=A0A518RIW2_9SPHN|nr:TrbC/VirB2 family protein [Sphingomonas suaedae]
MGDPLSGPSTSALVTAAEWIQGTLLGTLATTIAVIAIAWIGLGMLTGRIDLRRGATVVLGCFVLFGAPTIAAGLMRLGDASGTRAAEPIALAPPAPIVTPSPVPYDPYAGASVPVR